MTGWIWIAIIILAVLIVLFGIAHTWGIICFILLIVLLAVAVWGLFKDRVKVKDGKVDIDTNMSKTPQPTGGYMKYSSPTSGAYSSPTSGAYSSPTSGAYSSPTSGAYSSRTSGATQRS